MRLLGRISFLRLGTLILAFGTIILVLLMMRSTTIGPINCNVSSNMHNHLVEIGLQASHILTLQNVRHFLCYGSLWGALRNKKFLPWEANLDLCAMNEDLSKFDEVFLMRQFKQKGLSIEYDSKTGIYSVYEKSKDTGVVEINVFELVPDMKIVRRVGWTSRLLPPSSDHIDSFPDFLIQTPLSEIEFEGHKWPATREGLEIQKYHYKDNWWKEIKPTGC